MTDKLDLNTVTVPPGTENTILGVVVTLRTHRVPLAWDEHAEQILLLDKAPWPCLGPFPRPWVDSDVVHARAWFQAQGVRPRKGTIWDAIRVVADLNTRIGKGDKQ